MEEPREVKDMGVWEGGNGSKRVKGRERESRKIAGGDAVGQNGPFVCVCVCFCVATVNRCQALSSSPA